MMKWAPNWKKKATVSGDQALEFLLNEASRNGIQSLSTLGQSGLQWPEGRQQRAWIEKVRAH
jgi:hypothetical protein